MIGECDEPVSIRKGQPAPSLSEQLEQEFVQFPSKASVGRNANCGAYYLIPAKGEPARGRRLCYKLGQSQTAVSPIWPCSAWPVCSKPAPRTANQLYSVAPRSTFIG